MNIALLGYGRMGHEVEQQLLQRDHIVKAIVDNRQEWPQKEAAVCRCDVAIDFSIPSEVVDNIKRCFALSVPVVVGTTGWYDELPAIIEQCRKGGNALFVASNFSIGMNIMFDLNRRLASLMNSLPAYDATITETHHIHKLDAPSGTAITLANDIIERLDRKTSWQLAEGKGNPTPEALSITSIREGEVPGIHEVVYDSDVDTIRIVHSAKSRKGLALGAVLAAEFLAGRKGYYTMQDMLNSL